jgi:hypothetical protein
LLGTYVVALQGSWTIDGLGNDFVETTSFGDICKHFEFTMQAYGTVKFDGFFDMTDTNGQLALWTAFKNQSKLTNLKFYIDSTSRYEVDLTSDSSACIMITSVSPIAFSKADVGKISFSGQVSGPLLLV